MLKDASGRVRGPWISTVRERGKEIRRVFVVCSTSWPRMFARFTSIFTTCTRKPLRRSFGNFSRKGQSKSLRRTRVAVQRVCRLPAHAARGPSSRSRSGQRPARATAHAPARPPSSPTAFYILARGIALPCVARTRSSRIPGIKKPEPVRKTVPEVFRSTSPSLPLYHQKTLTCFHIVFFLALVFRFWRTSSVHRCEDSC